MATRARTRPAETPRWTRSRLEADPRPPAAQVVEAAVAVIAEESARAATTDRPTKRQVIDRRLGEARSVHTRKVNESFVAAAMVMDPKDSPIGGYPAPNAVTRTWQHAAWGYTRSVPELNAAMLFVGNCLSRCKLVVGKRDPDGSVEQAFTGDEPIEDMDSDVADEAAAAIAQLQMPRGGQSEMLRSFGEKAFVAGEAYVVPEDLPGGLVFEVLSTQELMPEGERYKRYYGPGWGTEDLPAGTKPIRIWHADGQYQMLATSSVRACLEVLEELVVLTRLVRAAAISRMSLAGILAIPDELDNPEVQDGPDGQSSEATNPLAVDMINTGAKAIDDPASAAAWMPYVLQGPADLLAHIRHIPFQTDDQENVIKRGEAVERLARGLDLPPEKVLGHMGTTFANAAQIDQDNFNIYIEPTLQLLCDALTVTYLWPTMAIARGITPDALRGAPLPDEILGVAITYDARKLISKPDRTAQIIEVYNKDQTFSTIAVAEMREALGLDPDKPPDLAEISRRINAFRLGRIREVVDAPPSDAAVSVEDAAAGRAAMPQDTVRVGATGSGSNDNGASTNGNGSMPEGAANQEAAMMSAAYATDPLRFLAERLAGAAEMAVERGVARVGARIRSKLSGRALSDSEKAAVRRVDDGAVTQLLGEARTHELLGDRDNPVLADVDAFAKLARGWARQFECADDVGVASEASTVVAGLIRRALYDPAPVDITADLFAEPILAVRVNA